MRRSIGTPTIALVFFSLCANDSVAQADSHYCTSPQLNVVTGSPTSQIQSNSIERLELGRPLSNFLGAKAREGLSLGIASIAPMEPLQQVEPLRSRDQASKVWPVKYSAAEDARLAASGPCGDALRSLESTLEAHQDAIRKSAGRKVSLPEFPLWYYSANTSSDDRDQVAPVIVAEQKYEKECLTGSVPAEFEETSILKSVGVLMIGDAPFCTALRIEPDEIATAKHCFYSEKTGAVQATLATGLRSGDRLWFAYQGEPESRFEVCLNLEGEKPPSGYDVSSDSIRVKISRTQLSRANIVWVSPPAIEGLSLYMRGYFVFSTGQHVLDRMRSTAFGGCAVSLASERCVFHGCQSLAAMSGAPIFLRPDTNSRDAVLHVAGLHIGPASIGTTRTCKINGELVDLSNLSYIPEWSSK